MEDAYRFLMAHGISTHDERSSQAIRRLQQDPAATKKFLVEHFLAEHPDQSRFGAPLLSLAPEEQMELVREIVAHYSYGDNNTPFTGILADSGTRKDMEIIAGLFDLHRDKNRAEALAVFILSRNNPHALEALVTFRERFPGKWLANREVKKFFAERDGNERRDGARPESGSLQTAQVKSQAPEALHAPEPRLPAPPQPSTAEHTKHTGWWLPTAIVVIVAGLLLVLRLARKRRRNSEAEQPNEPTP